MKMYTIKGKVFDVDKLEDAYEVYKLLRTGRTAKISLEIKDSVRTFVLNNKFTLPLETYSHYMHFCALYLNYNCDKEFDESKLPLIVKMTLEEASVKFEFNYYHNIRIDYFLQDLARYIGDAKIIVYDDYELEFDGYRFVYVDEHLLFLKFLNLYLYMETKVSLMTWKHFMRRLSNITK